MVLLITEISFGIFDSISFFDPTNFVDSFEKPILIKYTTTLHDSTKGVFFTQTPPQYVRY